MKKNNLLVLVLSCLVIGQAQAIEPVYSGDNGIRAKVFATNCLACHSSELTDGNRNGAPIGADFDTYSAALNHGAPAIKRGVTDMDMPPEFSALSKLDDEQKQALKNWQALGFPEKKLPTIYSSTTAKLTLPKIYLKDEKGDITLKWQAEMKLITGSQPLQFELTHVGEADAPSTRHIHQ
jgi:hypothetical protein